MWDIIIRMHYFIYRYISILFYYKNTQIGNHIKTDMKITSANTLRGTQRHSSKRLARRNSWKNLFEHLYYTLVSEYLKSERRVLVLGHPLDIVLSVENCTCNPYLAVRLERVEDTVERASVSGAVSPSASLSSVAAAAAPAWLTQPRAPPITMYMLRVGKISRVLKNWNKEFPASLSIKMDTEHNSIPYENTTSTRCSAVSTGIKSSNTSWW